MKPVPALLLNILTVVVALFLYDRFRGDAVNPGTSRVSSDRAEVGELVELRERISRIDAKLAALPARQREDRYDEPTRELGAAREPDPVPPKGKTKEPPTFADGPPMPAPQPDVPTKAEVARFRKLQEAVRRENSVKANWSRISAQLDKVGVNLTPAQREKVHYAWADFEPRINRIWGEIKTQARSTIDAGGAIDGKGLREEGSARIQSEFAASLGAIVSHPADAEAIAAALTARGGK